MCSVRVEVYVDADVVFESDDEPSASWECGVFQAEVNRFLCGDVQV